MSDNPWANSKAAANRPKKSSNRSGDHGDRKAPKRSDKTWQNDNTKTSDNPQERDKRRGPAQGSTGRLGGRPKRAPNRTDTKGRQGDAYQKKRRDNNESSFKRRSIKDSAEEMPFEKDNEKPRNPLTTEKKKGLPRVDSEGIVETQGERLQKVLANHDFGSRRDIEKLMLEGDVLVNGEIATLGMRVLGGEEVLIKGKAFTIPSVSANETEVLIYHKPVGQICSREDEKGRPTVFECIPKSLTGRWVMIGRLDINTSGLLIFTNNGALANTMMHPSNEVLRRYRVRVFGDLAHDAVEQLLAGVQLDDGPAQFEQCEFVAGRANNRWYNVSLREGRNREVRRMWQVVGGTVSRLIRVAYGPITLAESLKHGESRWASKSEMQELSALAGFDMSDAVIGDGSVHKVEPVAREERFRRTDSPSRAFSNKDGGRYTKSAATENRQRGYKGPKRDSRGATSEGRFKAKSGKGDGNRFKSRSNNPSKGRFDGAKSSPYKKRD